MKGYLGKPRKRDSDWLTAPCYYTLCEFIFAIHRQSEKALADKRKLNELKAFRDALREEKAKKSEKALINKTITPEVEPHPAAGVVCVPLRDITSKTSHVGETTSETSNDPATVPLDVIDLT